MKMMKLLLPGALCLSFSSLSFGGVSYFCQDINSADKITIDTVDASKGLYNVEFDLDGLYEEGTYSGRWSTLTPGSKELNLRAKFGQNISIVQLELRDNRPSENTLTLNLYDDETYVCQTAGE